MAAGVAMILGVASSFAQNVQVQALFTNAAMLKISGTSKMLKAGQSFGNVKLIEANSKVAVIELNGKRRELKVSQRITGNYEQAKAREVSIPRNSAMQYIVQATINGRAMRVLVDTGANVVAMNSAHATALGVDYAAGIPSQVVTASGTVGAWVVKLDSIDVGGIRVDNVQASVVGGTHPTTILLGMTYLQHVQMQEKNGILMLSRDY